MEFIDMKTTGRMVVWSVLSDSGETYSVTLDSEDNWSCDCPHFVYRLRRSKGKCKHIQWVISEQGGL